MKTASELLKEREIWFPAPMGGRKSKRQQVIEVMQEYSNQQLAEYKEKLKVKLKVDIEECRRQIGNLENVAYNNGKLSILREVIELIDTL